MSIGGSNSNLETSGIVKSQVELSRSRVKLSQVDILTSSKRDKTAGGERVREG